ncbi:MAG: protein kinase [Betaproteobacteria bacterium]|nr:protein kinase [Betaproteobacteria bacterium]
MLQRIGKYEIQRPVGKGASATVYLARDTFTGSDVALKVFDTSIALDTPEGETFHKQFMNEASLAGKLTHPHIVAILEAVVGDKTGHVAMEYVPGGNLAPYAVRDKLLPVEDAIEIGFKCCGALDYAFRHGIVHRDIKPANIMVVKGTEIKVADFGAALLRGGTSGPVLSIGSPAYMSPEQVGDMPLAYHSDMFSLAVVLYELVTGQRPFVASNAATLFQKILYEDPAPPSKVRAGVPPALDHALLRALSKQPQDRYNTWAEFALDLASIGGLSVYEKTVPDSEKYGALRKMASLQPFSDAEIWELVHASRWTRVPPRAVIVRENEPGKSLFLVAKGELKVTKQGRLLNVLKAGECFGEMAYIQEGAAVRQATVESLTDALLAEFESGALERLSESCQLRFARTLLRSLVERLALANVRIVNVVT